MSLHIEEEEYGKVLIGAKGSKVTLKGSIDHTKPHQFLLPFFETIHNQILDSGLKAIELDLYNLVFINSEAIKEIITWVSKLRSLPPEQVYKIKIILNSEQEWQEDRIKMIELICKDYIEKVIK